jgi:hypothetical protein
VDPFNGIARGYNLISIEEEGLYAKIWSDEVMDSVEWMAVMNIAEHHHILFGIDKCFQAIVIFDP